MNVYLFFSAFYAEIQDSRQKWRENNFWEKSPVDSADTLWVKKLRRNHSISYRFRDVFLNFTQKFKMAAKNGGKMIFGKKSPVDSADTLRVKNFVEIALSRTVSEILI